MTEGAAASVHPWTSWNCDRHSPNGGTIAARYLLPLLSTSQIPPLASLPRNFSLVVSTLSYRFTSLVQPSLSICPYDRSSAQQGLYASYPAPRSTPRAHTYARERRMYIRQSTVDLWLYYRVSEWAFGELDSSTWLFFFLFKGVFISNRVKE